MSQPQLDPTDHSTPPMTIAADSPAGYALRDLYDERIHIYDYPEGSGSGWIAFTGIPPAEPTEAMEERAGDEMEDAMLAYEEQVESFPEWVRSVYGHTITYA